MPDAIVHTVGSFEGTCQDGATFTGIAPANFGRRLDKFYDGKYSVEQVLTVGSLSRVRTANTGNDEWESLSRHVKDARLDILNVPHNWLCTRKRRR